VTGVAAGTSSTATITTTQTGYVGGTADVTATSLVAMSMVTVGNPGNAADTGSTYSGYGAVSYAYQIGKYDVTGSQYTAFLNAVASTDTYGLYNTGMGTNTNVAQISRSGSSGSYTYAVMNSTGSRPISYVTWFDSARFANWMSNGQPSGAQTSTTTENGTYNVNGATSGNAVAANATNPNTGLAPTFRMPLENEWYKAAYYSPNYGGTGVGGYWTYATQSDTAPGTTIGSSANQANYNNVIGTATNVGSFSGSGSFYGTFDQSGNVWQWNDLDGVAGLLRGLRGGSSITSTDYLSSSARFDYDPSYKISTNGFRLASPVTLGATGPGGGIIFYDAGSVQSWGRYLEVACAGWSDGTCGGNDLTDPQAEWGCSGTDIAGTGRSAIGTGRQNTTDIVNGCVTSDFTAAERADALLLGGLDDWFLPSRDELNALCKWAFNDTVNAICNNFGSGSLSLTNGGFSAGKYWSSSVYSATNAWTQLFNGGWQIAFLKTNAYYVRPVRAF